MSRDHVAHPADSGRFVESLKAQTRLTWPIESDVLARNVELSPCLRVADVCCGIGDFAARFHDWLPGVEITALDWSDTGIALAEQEYARPSIDFLVADATRLPLGSGTYDLVVCRHALQTMPTAMRDAVVRELVRICRPGGLVYITNEKNSLCYGSPGEQEIARGYDLVAEIWRRSNMDIECGPGQGVWLRQAGMTGVRTIPWIVSSDIDPDGFHALVHAWDRTYCEMARQVGFGAAELAQLQQGFAAHRHAALEGHAGWPIWSSLGRKPF